MIRRFCVATGNKNPLFRDEEYASNGPYGGVIAPPFFHAAIGIEAEELEDLEPSGLGKTMGLRMQVPVPGFIGAVAAGRHLTFGAPIRAGDLISRQETVVGVEGKQGKRDPMILVSSEFTYTNQWGEVVLRERQNTLRIQ